MWNAILNSMSEFKFVCPACGQDVKCESWRSNTMMECPLCFQRIIVPRAPTDDDVELVIKGSKATRRLVTKPGMDLGTPPAPTLPAKNSPVVGIALVVLLCAAVAGVFVLCEKILRTLNAQNTTAIQTRPVQPVNPAPARNVTPARPVIVAPPPNETNWTLTLSAAVIPDAPAAGHIHGKDFIRQHAYLEGGTLTMRTDNPGSPDLGLSVYLHANRSQDLAGRTVSITSDFTNAPPVRLRWKDDEQQPVTKDFKEGYALRIEFGQLAGKRLPGKFYLAVPDAMKSYVAGTFNAEIRKSKAP